MDIHLLEPQDRTVPLQRADRGYFIGEIPGVRAGARYRLVVDGKQDRPDPSSRSQPNGVHGASQVVSSAFEWCDPTWKGIALEDYILYELHVGTFTPAGTFDAAIERLPYLKELGITAIELMPVAQFPGSRNWGYDGTFPFAPQHSYGGPQGLRRLVDACHAHGLAVVLDVVYNHLGPEGNYFWGLAPYFTNRYCTPWGQALNYDDSHNQEVRRLFLENAVYWIEEFHIDALRLDAVHMIFDQSADPFLRQLTDAVHDAGRRAARRVYVFPESDLNEARLIRPWSDGGLGMDSAWSDDLHHALHTVLTREKHGYYADFGRMADLTKALAKGFVYDGQFSEFRQRPHGNMAEDLSGTAFTVCAQNHDQIGNRMLGERLSSLVSFEQQQLAAAMILLSPYLPLLFMGEEYRETAPFLFFIHHADSSLIESVRKGRRAEFASFKWKGEPVDPQGEDAFNRSRLQWHTVEHSPQREMRLYYQELIRLRKTVPAFKRLDRGNLRVESDEDLRTLTMHRGTGNDRIVAFFNFSDRAQRMATPSGAWTRLLDSRDGRWGGKGASPDMAHLDPYSLSVWQVAVS